MTSPADELGATLSKQEIRRQRGPLSGLIADKMRASDMRNVDEFATYAGLSKAAVYNVLNGRMTNGGLVMPNHDTEVKLARALGKPLHEIIYLLDPSAPGADEVLGVEMLPVFIAGHVGAGPTQLQELDEAVYVERAFADHRDLLAFRVRGDSMAGGSRPIYNDNVVIIDRKQGGEINAPVVARLRDDGHVVKRLRSGGYLDSTNPEYQDEHLALIQPERVAQILGRVVRIMADLV